MQATRIVAVRHGETAWNVGARMQGHLDIPLNANGRWQAERLAAALAGETFDAVYASDLSRALDTGRAIGLATGVDVTVDAALRERHFGSFQGRTFADIEAEHPAQALRWRKRDPDFAADGGGESLVVLHARVTAAIDRLAARHTGGQIVIATHGGVLDVLYRAATGQSLQAPRSWVLANAAINRMLWTPDALTLVGWGDDAHLQGARDDATA